jgi:outer membrane protein
MRRKLSPIISLIFLASHCVGAGAARDVSQLHLQSGTGDWSLGTGFRYGTFPYVGEDTEEDFLPLITYSGEHFFIDGTRTGFHLYNTEDWLVGTYVAYRFGGFNEEDSKELDGMDRDDGVDARFAITRKTSFGDFTLDTGADIRDKSNGWDAQLRWGKTLRSGDFLYRPWIGLTYEDQNLANYYYGVKSSEATAERPAYETDSALEWSYGIDTSYRLSQHHYVGLNLQYTQLDSTKLDSPTVDENGVFHSFLSYRYEYNDYRDDPTVSGGLLRDLTKGEWYWRVAAGRTTKSSLHELITFREMFDAEERDTGLASVFLGKKVTDEFLWLPMDGYVTGGLVRRFERGEQDDFNEYVLGFKAYYSDFPWSDRVKTRVGIAEGVSYVEHLPIVERENIESKNRSGSHFLNYMDWSWDVSIGDLFNQPSLKECYFGWSVHHRSGIFGSSDFFGNVDGGGNVNTLYLQCHNKG